MSDAARKIAVIVALDVAGYSARTEADEARTTAEVAALRQVIEAIARAHGGRVFNTAGDGFMLEFSSSLAAVEAAGDLAAKCEPKVRVGVHLGDVVVQPNGDLLGHGVNVAARLMAKSDPGGVLVSAMVRQTIRGPIAERLISRGAMHLDKMAETIEAFALSTNRSAVAVASSQTIAEPVLAVLPFDNLSDDTEMQYFSDGVSEEILQTIARARGLRVIGKASSFQLRGKDKSVRKAVADLGATHVLDGSVRRAGSRIRVNAQLVDGRSQTTLWNDRYDRELRDIFELQDELAAAIASVLQTRFTPSRKAPSIAPEVLETYLKARAQLLRDWSPLDRRLAIPMLEQVVSLEPDFAAAWGMLAVARSNDLPMDRDAIGEPVHRAIAAASQRALEIDPANVDGRVAQLSLLPAFGEYLEKMKIAEEVAVQAPNETMALNHRALALMMVGRGKEAVAIYRDCIARDPLSNWLYALCAHALNVAGQSDEAEALLDDATTKFPQGLQPWMTKLMFASAQRRWDTVSRYLEHDAPWLKEVFPEVLEQIAWRARCESMTEREREATFREALSRSGEPLDLMTCSAAVNYGLLELFWEAIFNAIESRRAIASLGSRWFQAVVFFHAPMRPCRNDKRFPILCARVGLVDYWMTSGHWPDCADEVPYDFKAECEKAAREVARL